MRAASSTADPTENALIYREGREEREEGVSKTFAYFAVSNQDTTAVVIGSVTGNITPPVFAAVLGWPFK